MFIEEDTSRNHNKPIVTTEKLIVKQGEDIHLKKMKIPSAIIPNGAAPGVVDKMQTDENDSYIVEDQYYQNEKVNCDPKKIPEDPISERLMRYG